MLQFELRQLAWAVGIASVYFAIVGLALRDGTGLRGESVIWILLATGPTLGSLVGLFRNRSKGMLVGFGHGAVITTVLAWFLLPDVQ